MSLKENLKKKILIDTLSRTVFRSIGPPGSSRKIDKEIAACEKPLVRTTHCVAVVIPVGALEAYAKLLDDHVE